VCGTALKLCNPVDKYSCGKAVCSARARVAAAPGTFRGLQLWIRPSYPAGWEQHFRARVEAVVARRKSTEPSGRP